MKKKNLNILWRKPLAEKKSISDSMFALYGNPGFSQNKTVTGERPYL